MRKSVLLIIVVFLISAGVSAEITSLSRVFALDQGLRDLDGDGCPETIDLVIVVPDAPTVEETALAADVAARTNLESLVVHFSLVRKESELGADLSGAVPIFIGANLKRIRRLIRDGHLAAPPQGSSEGFVSLIPSKAGGGIAVLAGSPASLVRTGRAFFLRWPYLWDIWGRETGATFDRLESDLLDLLDDLGSKVKIISVTGAHYDFPSDSSPFDALRRLRFDRGEIRRLEVRLDFEDKASAELADRRFEELRRRHLRGDGTDVLTYPGCRELVILCRAGEENSAPPVILPRPGFPKRLLTPSYKSAARVKVPERNFDLLNWLTPQGLYNDADGDGIADGIDAFVVICGDTSWPGLEILTSKLVLETAGASFPLVQVDHEIEKEKNLKAPVLIGRTNRLVRELIKMGKMTEPRLPPNVGRAEVVSKAFNASNALVITGGGEAGRRGILTYLGRTFPNLQEYGPGRESLKSVYEEIEGFFAGENGAAEAFFETALNEYLPDIEDKSLDSVSLEFYLPEKNTEFERYVADGLMERLDSPELDIRTVSLRDGRMIFELEKQFPWEVDTALARIGSVLDDIEAQGEPLWISAGVSESPEIRNRMMTAIEEILAARGLKASRIQVLSSYKQGFFWLLEEVLPRIQAENAARLLIRFAEAEDDFSRLKRFYTEPYRWLQELYPVDDLISEKTGLPLDRIVFEKSEGQTPVYQVQAFDQQEKTLFTMDFSPRTRDIDYLTVLPEWGSVVLTTGWIEIGSGDRILHSSNIQSDLELFWDFYQKEILTQVYDHIKKSTGNQPDFSKQPYFKRLEIEMTFSEPDFPLGLDQEIVSSLEAMHDEIYFDTLDFLRGITDVELDEEDVREDASRYSAPGNILPLIHPSSEGEPGRVRITFEDWQARSPKLVLKFRERGKDLREKTFIFPKIDPEELRVCALTHDALKNRLEILEMEARIEKESDYLDLIETIESHRRLSSESILKPAVQASNLGSLRLKLNYQELSKEESLQVEPPPFSPTAEIVTREKKDSPVPTDKILSPHMVLDIIDDLGRSSPLRSYLAGRSYEGRSVPVLEAFLPQARYVSRSRLIARKPTLYLSGRQHANEVSSTNYILKFAELLGRDETLGESLKKINFVLHPMENPDGAELAFRLQTLTPFHSLHAGRYTSLGIDVGYQVGTSKPLLPEAKVRAGILRDWVPDIHLNLHGYPSHEWVQQFSSYSPYLFRDYWIPRGWFAYFNSVSLPFYREWTEAANSLKTLIRQEMAADETIRLSNEKFYDRYFRWAARWQPHMDYLEIEDGVNLYAKRRSSGETRLSERRRWTFVQETPELMDETARGAWLDFLVSQGLAYLRAHIKYLADAQFEVMRFEEESRERIHIQWARARPGLIK